MALESVDLLSLLKRARKTNPAPEAAEAAAAGTPPAEKAEQTNAPSAASDSPAPQVHAVEELADLRAELVGDEVLIQRILGLLYRYKKKNPNGGYISILDMERILHIEREGATFVMSYMKTQKVIEMDDKSRMAITVPGIDYLRRVLGVQAEPASQVDDLEPTSRE